MIWFPWRNGCERRGWLGLSLLLVACNGHGSDEESDAASMSVAEEQCEAARTEVAELCFSPHGLSDIEGPDRPMLVDIAESAEALEGGYFLPKVETGSDPGNAAIVLADNEVCQVACLVQCNLETQSLCISSWEEPGSCSFCGNVTRDECQDFIASCGS